MSIGENLSRARKRKGLSQEAVAEKLNVSRQSVSLWETDQNQPTLDNLTTLSDLYGVSVSVLLGQVAFPEDRQQQQQINLELKREKEREAYKKKDATLFGILALMACILAIFLFLVPGLGIVVSIVAVILSIVSLSNKHTRLNSVTLIIGVVYVCASLIALIALKNVNLPF